jgi:hypothetical protein
VLFRDRLVKVENLREFFLLDIVRKFWPFMILEGKFETWFKEGE